ncbi:MAG TPA: PEPxxWA-CTERM sorting domain-containing protein [Rhodocyclaceae bacterium]|nr:PEPxxWA-CTERM sorting domain-containing protein [Rhodocyclaceae bacterium]
MSRDIKRIFAAAAIVSSTAGVFSPASAANLVVNGSFEDDVIASYPWYTLSVPTGWAKGGSAGDASVWRIGYVDGGGNITVAGEGSQFVTMGGGYLASGTTIWSQTVGGLTIGQAYDLKFKIASEGPCCGTQSVSVGFLGSSTPGQVFSATPITSNYWKDWNEKGMTLVASATSVTIQFTYSGRYDMGLDDVRMTAAVPEPETYALMLAGLGALGAAVRRRKR